MCVRACARARVCVISEGSFLSADTRCDTPSMRACVRARAFACVLYLHGIFSVNRHEVQHTQHVGRIANEES